MIQIKFKNVDRSELAKEATTERLMTVVDRFPDLKSEDLVVTLSMENSPTKPGPDVFTVKVYCRRGRYKNLVIQKSASSLYVALADIVDHLLERLNRYGDRIRVKSRQKARDLNADPS